MSISIINTSEINREELGENSASSVGEDSLTKKWSEYVLETPSREINFRENPSLVQRIKFDDDGSTSYDYMGSSEFEWCAVGRAVAKMIEWQNKGELVIFTCDDGIEGLCHISMVKEVKEQAVKLIEGDKNPGLNSKFSLQEQLYSERFSNFLCLDNIFYFSTSGEALKYLQHLDYTDLRKNYIAKIEDHPKYVELNGLTYDVYSFLKDNGIDIIYIGIHTSRVLNSTYEKGTIEDEDFEGAVWINSKNRYIYTGGFSEDDLLDALELKGRLFTDAYWLDNGNFVNIAGSRHEDSIEEMVDIFVGVFNGAKGYKYRNYSREEIMSDIDKVMEQLVQNSSLNRQIIDRLVLSQFFDNLLSQNLNTVNYLITLAGNVHASDKVIKKANQVCRKRKTKQQRKLREALNNRKLEISNIGKQTVEDIKRVYTEGTYTCMYSGKQEKGFAPYNLSINFSNNLARMGFKTKELNVYVDPNEYEREYNEILVWEPEHNGARVEVGINNYEGVKGCLYMEELTGVKCISNRNIAYERDITYFTFNRYYGNGEGIYKMLSRVEELQGIDINTIFWLFSRVHDTEEGVREEDIYRIMEVAQEKVGVEDIKKLRDFSIEGITYDYFRETFPGEFTDDEYNHFSVRLNEGLHEQLDKLLSFIEENKDRVYG